MPPLSPSNLSRCHHDDGSEKKTSCQLVAKLPVDTCQCEAGSEVPASHAKLREASTLRLPPSRRKKGTRPEQCSGRCSENPPRNGTTVARKIK